MSKRAYIPRRGDIVHANLGSTAGREFDGPHYLLVISSEAFNRKLGLCIVLPTTSKNHPELGTLSVKLPTVAGLDRDGWVLLHHVRSVDFRERSAEFAACLDFENTEHEGFMVDLVDRLFTIVES